MKKLLLFVLAFVLVGCSAKPVQETNEEPTIEKAKEIISSLVFDEGKGYKVEAFEQRPVDYSSIDTNYMNTYIYETYRNPTQQISVSYRYSGVNHIFTKVGVYDSRDGGHYFEIGNDNTEYVTITQPLGEMKKEGKEYTDDLPLYILESMNEVKNIEIGDDQIVVEFTDQSESSGIAKYEIQEKQIQSIQISYNGGAKQGSIYKYVSIGDEMKKAEEISLLVQNVDYEVKMDQLPFNDELTQNEELNKVVNKIESLDFSIAESVDVYIQDVQNKRDVVIHSLDYTTSTDGSYIEYSFAYDENDDLDTLITKYINIENPNGKMYEIKKANDYKLEDANYANMHKDLYGLIEPLYGIIDDLKVEENGENIQVVGKTTEGTVCINYYIENNHLVEMREDLYADSDMKNLKYCYYISTQVPAWEYFESEFNAIESKSLDEIKKLDYFKVGL